MAKDAAQETDNGATEPDPFDIQEDPHDSMTVQDFKGETDDVVESDSGDEDDFGSDLLQRASDAGFDEQSARALGTPDALISVLDTFDRQLAAVGRTEDTAESDAADTSDATSNKGSGEQFRISLDSEVVEPVVQQAFDQVVERYESAISDLTEAVDMLLGHVESEGRSRESERFDGFVDSLGKDYQDLFGNGPTDVLRDGSVQRRNRDSVLDEMRALREGYGKIGRKAPSEKELFQRALRGVFGDKISSMARREIAGKLDRRSKSHINRPTSRSDRDLTPRQRAIRSVGSKMAEKGMGDTDLEEAEMLPSELGS